LKTFCKLRSGMTRLILSLGTQFFGWNKGFRTPIDHQILHKQVMP
jgi:hypothetical protein